MYNTFYWNGIPCIDIWKSNLIVLYVNPSYLLRTQEYEINSWIYWDCTVINSNQGSVFKQQSCEDTCDQFIHLLIFTEKKALFWTLRFAKNSLAVLNNSPEEGTRGFKWILSFKEYSSECSDLHILLKPSLQMMFRL